MSGFQITMIGRMGAYQRKYHFTDSVLRGMWGQENFHHNFSQGLTTYFSFKFDIYMGEHPIVFTHILDIVRVIQTYLRFSQAGLYWVILSTQDLDGKKSIKA